MPVCRFSSMKSHLGMLVCQILAKNFGLKSGIFVGLRLTCNRFIKTLLRAKQANFFREILVIQSKIDSFACKMSTFFKNLGHFFSKFGKILGMPVCQWKNLGSQKPTKYALKPPMPPAQPAYESPPALHPAPLLQTNAPSPHSTYYYAHFATHQPTAPNHWLKVWCFGRSIFLI